MRSSEILTDGLPLHTSAANVRGGSAQFRSALEKSDRIHSLPEYLAAVADASFIFSPPGAGWDCYRTWEALYLGTVPILLKTGTPFDDMYADLPVLFVDSYLDVTEAMLLSALSQLKTADFNWEKLTADYWKDKIRQIAAAWVNDQART